MRSSHLRWLLIAAAGAVCVAAVAATAQAAGPNGPGRHVLPGTRPSWTASVPKAATVPAAQLVHAKVWLAPRNSTQLDALAQAVSDPSSSQYGQFISDDQYRAQFAPTAAQVAQITQWLTKAGLNVDSMGPDAHFIAVSGSAESVNSAFGTQLATFVVNGEQTQAPTSDLSVPDSVADIVLAVSGLTTFGHKMAPADFGAPVAFVNGIPCSAFYGQQLAKNLPKFQGKTLPWAVCGYTPDQFRGAYGIDDSGHNYSFQAVKGGGGGGDNAGKGVTVAITDAYDAPTLLQDANTYAARHGDRPFAHGQFVDKSVPEDASTEDDCGGNGWYGEQTLDVEAVHGMAQGANVLYYGAASCFDDDLLAALSQIVHDNKASIVTNSWGSPTFFVIDGQLYITIDQNLVDAYESVFKHGAVQGIGFYFSSGDNGDDLASLGVRTSRLSERRSMGDRGRRHVAGDRTQRRPAVRDRLGHGEVQPHGRRLELDASEPVDPFLYGAGGGYSQVFPRPLYQRGVVPSDTTGRAVPDIAMDGDPTTGMLIGETQDFSLPSRFGPAGIHYGEYRIGGTSLSSPLFAGVQAVAQSGVGRRIGFANPFIYSAFRAHVFYDVTPQGDAGNVRADYANGQNADGGIVYSVRTFDQDSSLTTGPGWDDVTGVGSAYRPVLRRLPRRALAAEEGRGRGARCTPALSTRPRRARSRPRGAARLRGRTSAPAGRRTPSRSRAPRPARGASGTRRDAPSGRSGRASRTAAGTGRS